MLMDMFICCIVSKLDNEQPPLREAPPVAVVMESSTHSTQRSIETLIVVLAVITIAGVIAGIFARVCGGRQFRGSGEDDMEGCVERRCKSCIDGGVPPPPENIKAPATEEAKK
ncbi:uncharacterized protein LOC122643174 [Telopea speciosissima]|uniref:uncharacterized protein LOC122643174 n=1 Tax=Telopea speciosissima TaxID=54955 RepID=UPI001CC693E3|nr:uncharacterized protein LOC122643174 [Telopea speciosissima]